MHGAGPAAICQCVARASTHCGWVNDAVSVSTVAGTVWTAPARSDAWWAAPPPGAGDFVPGARVARFGPEALPQAADMDGLMAAIRAKLPGVDACLVHATDRMARAIPRGYVRGNPVFGCGTSIGEDVLATNGARMRSAITAVLHRAVYSPQSGAVVCAGTGFYEPSLANIRDRADAFDPLVAMDPLYDYDSQRQVTFTSAVAGITTIDRIAMPVCGNGFHNYGHFLFDGLPFASLLATLLPDVPIAFVGPRLSDWQRAILAALGLLDRYLPLDGPTRFARLIVSDTLTQHVAYPSRLIRPMLDTLRYRLGARETRRRRVFVSRRTDTSKRVMRNRAEVEAAIAAMGFEIVAPDTLPFAEQVRLFAACDVVIGESGAGMANVAFCDPGTLVLEIQPENFFEGWTRNTSMVMGLEWHVYFARAVAGAAQGAAFSVDVPTLRAAVATVLRGMWPAE
jgi:capsular polysaccharide biosynthesis protein